MWLTRLITALAAASCFAVAPKAATGLGPFEVYDADSNCVRLNLAFQTRFDFERKNTRSDHPDNDARMYLKSIRPTVSGRFLDDRLSFKLHFNLIPGSPELMDMYFGWKPDSDFQVRFGQYKVPFTRYRIQSLLKLTFVDWSITSRYFGAERQLGVSLHNGYENPPRWEYAVGLFTGRNARASHGVGLAKTYGVALESRSNLAGSGGTTEFNPELVARLGYNSGGIRLQSESDPEGGPFRYSLGVSAAWDLDPLPYEDFTWRLAPELLVKDGRFSTSVIGYWAGAELGPHDCDKLAARGLLAESAYRIDRNWELTARWAAVQLTDALIADVTDLAVRSEAGEGPAIPAVDAQTEFSVGANYYIIEHQLKLQLTLDWQRSFTDRRDFVAQSQFQLTF